MRLKYKGGITVSNNLDKDLKFVFENIGKLSTDELVKHIKPHVKEIISLSVMQECIEDIA